ncbi:hypothetical protein Lal_00033364 [Lupinus albus]|nr:hypothetical protein Lal_00033364 [Lupinus albus]
MIDIVVIGGNERRSKGWRKSRRKLVKLLETDSNAHQVDWTLFWDECNFDYGNTGYNLGPYTLPRPDEPNLAQARILQYSPVFHSPSCNMDSSTSLFVDSIVMKAPDDWGSICYHIFYIAHLLVCLPPHRCDLFFLQTVLQDYNNILIFTEKMQAYMDMEINKCEEWNLQN